MTTSDPKGSAGCGSAPAGTQLNGTQLGRGGRRREHPRLAPIGLKALAALSEQGPRHGANATGALGQTKRNQPDGRPKPLSPRRYWGFGAQSNQPGQSIQRYINPSRTSWNDGGAGDGSAEIRAITSRGPCRCSSAAVVQWISGCSSEAKRSQRRSSIVSSTSHTAGTCSATFPLYLHRHIRKRRPFCMSYS